MTSESMSPDPAPPPVIRAARVERPPNEAFSVFTEEIGAWWPLPTHGLFGGDAGGVCFRDGRLIEQSVDGTEVVWGEVRTWDPPNRLVLSWHPGRDVADHSEVEVVFIPDGGGTRVVVEHRGWHTFGEDAMARRRGYVGPGAWGHVLDHYADGAEARVDAADLTALEAAYEAFFAEAAREGFGPPPDGEWNADQVIAHVALNDSAMLGVCHSLVQGESPRFGNTVSQDPEVLGRWIRSTSGPDDRIERGRHQARLVLAALARLSPDQLATDVHCHLFHDGDVMVDAPRPWAAVAIEVQAAMHLPAHLTQLRDLRESR